MSELNKNNPHYLAVARERLALCQHKPYSPDQLRKIQSEWIASRRRRERMHNLGIAATLLGLSAACLVLGPLSGVEFSTFYWVLLVLAPGLGGLVFLYWAMANTDTADRKEEWPANHRELDDFSKKSWADQVAGCDFARQALQRWMTDEHAGLARIIERDEVALRRAYQVWQRYQEHEAALDAAGVQR